MGAVVDLGAAVTALVGWRVGVLVGISVFVGGTGVAVGTAVLVGGTGVLVGADIAVGGTGVSVGGNGVIDGSTVGATVCIGVETAVQAPNVYNAQNHQNDCKKAANDHSVHG